MLSDIIEEEFDIKEEEPWYDHQDLEHDLHLAAELGKNLLERNRELEQRLQQMYTTNQEQCQEIEHLSKQVDLLRSVNDQHAKVYEQLDVMARDLEQKNHRLVLENRSAQTKIEGLTETVDGLQMQVDDLHRDMKKLVSSKKNLQIKQPDHVQCPTCTCQFYENSCEQFYSASHSALIQEVQEEASDLTRSMNSLQAQLNTERSLREATEREADALARNLSELEPKLALLEDYKDRMVEMETEVKELRHTLRSNTTNLLPDTILLSPEVEVGVVRKQGRVLNRCSSEKQLHSSCDEGGVTDNVNESRRGWTKNTKHEGISLLNEVDAQYTALQEKYDTLLRQCESGKQKAFQTPVNSSAQKRTQDDAPIPEYKVLFEEIFTFIQKSRKDLKENRIKPSQVE